MRNRPDRSSARPTHSLRICYEASITKWTMPVMAAAVLATALLMPVWDRMSEDRVHAGLPDSPAGAPNVLHRCQPSFQVGDCHIGLSHLQHIAIGAGVDRRSKLSSNTMASVSSRLAPTT